MDSGQYIRTAKVLYSFPPLTGINLKDKDKYESNKS